MPTTCPYTLLGIAADASAEEITAAYGQALSLFRRGLAENAPLPVEHLDAVREAYRTLSSPARRRAHDRRAGRPLASPPAALPAAEDVPAASSPDSTVVVEFRGSGAEYLRIWLVNIALTLLTLGIYSAWAKVRREKYFHRNIVVDGAPLDYHGKPRAILAGRVVLAVAFALANLAEYFGAGARLAVWVALAAAFPWLLVSSMRFRACNTSYRGVRFRFSGTYRQALVLYLFHGGLALLTLGLYFPVFLQRQKAFLAGHLSFGDRSCRFEGRPGTLYRDLSIPLILWILALLASALAVRALPPAYVVLAAPAWLAVAALLTQLFFLPYARVAGTNLFWNHTAIGGTRFSSTQKPGAYLGLAFSNWLLTLLTLGFFWPLAHVRLASYRARNLAVIAPQGLDRVAAGGTGGPKALGSEAMDALSLDLSL